MRDNNNLNNNQYDDWSLQSNKKKSNSASYNKFITKSKLLTSIAKEQTNTNPKQSINIKKIIAIITIIIDFYFIINIIAIFLAAIVGGAIAYCLQGVNYGAEIEYSFILFISKVIVPEFISLIPGIIIMLISFIWAKKQL